MYNTEITIADGRLRFVVGETVRGTVRVAIPVSASGPVEVRVSFHCLAEVKWTEHPGNPPSESGAHVRFGRQYYHSEHMDSAKFTPDTPNDGDKRVMVIPFAFTIPKDSNLPSTVHTKHGFVTYFVRVSTADPTHASGGKAVQKIIKEVIVHSPVERDLTFTVSGSADKTVLLHQGRVSVHAALDRKGWAPGESASVRLSVANTTNTAVVSELELRQVQVFTCVTTPATKTVVTTVGPTVTGTAIAPHTNGHERLSVAVPASEALTTRCSLLSLKYYVHLTVAIPHSFDLHVNLPVVVTAPQVIAQLFPNAAAADASSTRFDLNHLLANTQI